MSFLRSFSISLRNALSRFYPLFSCCASCGEIRVPLGNRLCASLSPQFGIDAVIVDSSGDVAAFAKNLKIRLPWLGKTFFIRQKGEDMPEELPAGVFSLPASALASEEDGADRPPLEALLHLLPQLSEHYLTFTSAQEPPASLLSLDFFTPNGIPLIPAAALAQGLEQMLASSDPLAALKAERGLFGLNSPAPGLLLPYPQTKDNSSGFLPFFMSAPQHEGASPELAYRFLLQQWLFLTGRGAPSPEARL